MKALLQPVRLAARVGYLMMTWILVALVFVQVFLAGSAVMVSPGNWAAHAGGTSVDRGILSSICHETETEL